MSAGKPSVLKRARHTKGALLLGCGGGGDCLQAIPVMNYLRELGVERFVLAEYALKWWDKPGFVPFGCEIVSIDRLTHSRRVHPNVAIVSADTVIERGTSKVMPESARGIPLYEAVVTREFKVPVASISVARGAQGVLEGLRFLMSEYQLDLFITVDIGADAFYSGQETTVQSPLADAISLYCAAELDGYYGLAGYACDAELPNDHLDRNVARVMQVGGYVGAHGLTPDDVEDLTRVLDYFPNEAVEHWPRDAARGRLGTQYCKGFWHMYVSPLAAVTLFFDPVKIMTVNPIPAAIGPSRSILEAENAVLDNFNLIPETRLPLEVPIPIPPQVV
jgi:hypothetical protein